MGMRGPACNRLRDRNRAPAFGQVVRTKLDRARRPHHLFRHCAAPDSDMIISASYKTDIPAFYGRWFMARLEAGYCRMVNPYGCQIYRVALDPTAVDGFVFWTKNLEPFRIHLPAIAQRGYPFMVQYTINNYPRALEYSVTDAARAHAHMHALAKDFGPDAAVWRYDPILLTTLTPVSWHLENFETMARKLAGATDEVIISFAHFYRKTRRNLAAAARAFDFGWHDPPADEKRSIAARLAGIAGAFGMRLTMCAQPEYASAHVGAARCIDATRLSTIAGRRIDASLKGNRPGCGCYASRDIGEYDTCPHGCVYCYAVQHRGLARRRFKTHDSASAFLFAPDRNPPPDDGPRDK